MTNIINLAAAPLFPLGQLVATPGAVEACPFDYLKAYLERHAQRDWGCVCTEDWSTNEEALENGNRILSAYPIDPSQPSKGYGENTIWIITEADRSVTTILLPSEY